MRLFRSLVFIFKMIIYYYLALMIMYFLPYPYRDKLQYRFALYLTSQLRKQILALEGLFIKLGQYFSVVGYLYSSELAKSFEFFQDSVRPRSYESIQDRFLEVWGLSPKVLFDRFDEIPIASASLGQVHFARTYEGESVAVKVLYPNIEILVEKDLRLICFLMHIVAYVFPVYDVKQIYNEFSKMIYDELNYEQEIENLKQIQNHFKNHPNFIFPKVYKKYSCKTILTTEFISGMKLSLFQNSIDPIHHPKIAELLIFAYFKMVVEDHAFHADPHPGNWFVIQEKNEFKLAFIDFGSVKFLNKKFSKSLVSFFKAFLNRDILHLISILKKMGIVIQSLNPIQMQELEQIFDFFFDQIDNLNQLNSKEQFEYFFNITSEIQDHLGIELKKFIKFFKISPEYLYLWRTLALIFSLAGRLDKNRNVFLILWPYIDDYMQSDKAIFEHTKDQAYNFFNEFVYPLIHLPKELLKLTHLMNQNRFRMHVLNFNQEALAKQFKKMLFLIGGGIIVFLFY